MMKSGCNCISIFLRKLFLFFCVFYEHLARKRHRAWANSQEIHILDRGVLSKKARAGCVLKTTTKTKKGNKTQFQGNRWLKGTQSYPISFGLRILRFLPQLQKHGQGQPVLPAKPPGGWDAPAQFEAKEWNPQEWSEAYLVEACKYMRGSTNLRVPDRWKRVFPTTY